MHKQKRILVKSIDHNKYHHIAQELKDIGYDYVNIYSTIDMDGKFYILFGCGYPNDNFQLHYYLDDIYDLDNHLVYNNLITKYKEMFNN